MKCKCISKSNCIPFSKCVKILHEMIDEKKEPSLKDWCKLNFEEQSSLLLSYKNGQI